MNIFAFDPCPVQSALWLDDKRKNKMILESCQLMSSAIRQLDPFTSLPVYKLTHQGHPCTKWTRVSRANFKWVLSYTKALYDQKTGGHKSSELFPFFEEYVAKGSFPVEHWTPFVNCARNVSVGLDFTGVSCVHTAYKQYIMQRWLRDSLSPTWKWGVNPLTTDEWKGLIK